MSSTVRHHKDFKTLNYLLTMGYWIDTNSPQPAPSCHCYLSCQQQCSVTVGPHTIDWCLYVMTPQLKPIIQRPVTSPPPSPSVPSQLLLVSDHLEATRGHSFPWVQWSHLAAAAAWPTLACTVTLQLSPGTHPSQGQHCSHILGCYIWKNVRLYSKL